jgi:hypothetical protein
MMYSLILRSACICIIYLHVYFVLYVLGHGWCEFFGVIIQGKEIPNLVISVKILGIHSPTHSCKFRGE